MFISRREVEVLKHERICFESMLIERTKEKKELNDKIYVLCELLGYEENKKKITKWHSVGDQFNQKVEAYLCFETKDEFVNRLAEERNEKRRLEKIVADIKKAKEMGIK